MTTTRLLPERRVAGATPNRRGGPSPRSPYPGVTRQERLPDESVAKRLALVNRQIGEAKKQLDRLTARLADEGDAEPCNAETTKPGGA